MINPFLFFLLFFKATVFSSGGFSNLPSLHQDLLADHWAVESDFGQSIAIGQISPGPNGLWVISLGYFTYGWLGALLALIAITIPPCFVLVVESAYHRLERQRWVTGLMRGVSLAVVGILLSVAYSIVNRPGVDWTSLVLCAVAFGLAATKRVNIVLILGMAAIAGYLLYGLR